MSYSQFLTRFDFQNTTITKLNNVVNLVVGRYDSGSALVYFKHIQSDDVMDIRAEVKIINMSDNQEVKPIERFYVLSILNEYRIILPGSEIRLSRLMGWDITRAAGNQGSLRIT